MGSLSHLSVRANFFQSGTGDSLSKSFLEKNALCQSLTITPSASESLSELDLQKLLSQFDCLAELRLVHAAVGLKRQPINYSHLCRFNTLSTLVLRHCDVVNSPSLWPDALSVLILQDCNLLFFDNWRSSCRKIHLENCSGFQAAISFSRCLRLTHLSLSGSSTISSISGLNKGLIFLDVGGISIQRLSLPITLFGLNVSGCSELVELVCDMCPDLIKLEAQGCVGLVGLDLTKLDWLSELNLSGCISLISLLLPRFSSLPVGPIGSSNLFRLDGCINLKTIKAPNSSE